MTSVAQIVRKIIDDLSDGVSELVLLVVILAEQDAALPDELPPAANVVNQTANQLARIARELAKTEYVDFPEIGTDINKASDDVEDATKKMANAVKTLQGAKDRKSGWNNLIDACRVMSGKTILLLQIVYGAELKRLQIAADRLGDSIAAVDLKGDLTDPNKQAKLASQISPITQEAVKLAQYLAERANDNGISPYAQDQLKKCAGDLNDRTQKLIDATNEAFGNPEAAPKVRAALDDLDKHIKQAKKLANDLAPEEPKLENLRKLLPLLEKAHEAVAQVPKAVKEPAKYERAEKAAKDATQEVVRQLKPNPKRYRDADKLEEDLANQILAARKALQSPGNPQANKDLDNATQKLLDALNNLKKNNPDKKLTPEQKNDIQKALENLKKTFGPALYKKPEDKVEDAYERLKDDLDHLKNAARNQDPKLLNNKARMAVQAAKDLAQAMQDPERIKRLPAAQRKAQEDAAKEILDNLPRFVRNVNAVKNKPDDEPAVEDLLDAIRRLKRAADRPNKPKDERDFRDNYNDILAGLKRVGDRMNDDPKGTQDALDDLARALENLRKVGDRLKEKNPNPQNIERPLGELQQIFDKIRQKAPLASKGDKNAPREVMDNIPKMHKALDDLNNATRALDIAPIDDVEDALDDVTLAASSIEPERYKPAIKELVQRVNDLGNHVDTFNDPKLKQLGRDVLDRIKPAMRDYAMKAAEVADNKASPDELVDYANRIKGPLNALKRAIEPASLDRNPEAAGAAVKKALEGLRHALKGGDPTQVRKALNDLKDAMDKYNNIIDGAANNVADPRKRAQLQNDAKELHELAGDLRRADPTNKQQIRKLLDQIPDRMDDWSDSLGNTEAQDLRKAAAKAANLQITLGTLDEDDMDLGDLLDTASQLRHLMRGLIGDTTSLARQLGSNQRDLTAASKAALDLDKYLLNLESGDAEIRPPSVPLSYTTSESFDSAPDEFFEQLPLSQAKTFDQVLAAVANEMHLAAKGMSKEADNIATELAKLAKAARGGSKQDMLIAAKSASAFIIAFCKQMETLANQIPGRTMAEKREQDNLIKYQTVLKNYGTQLKILSSVKAASIEESRDTDATLTTLTMNLGDVVQASLRSMAITRDAIFGGKLPKLQ